LRIAAVLCPEGEVHIWTTELTGPASPAATTVVLDELEWERADRFVDAVHRRRFITAHCAVRQILAGYDGSNPAELRIQAGENGKPYLLDSPLRFNVTHSGERALLAVAVGRELGVDIEVVRPFVDVLALAARFLLPEEHQQLTMVPQEDQLQAFFCLWVRREAFLKATGEGLKGLARPFDPESWTLLDLTPDPGYVAALVVEGTLRPEIRCKPHILGDVTVLR
jgi:4'-phosphopantetheinyl transferase